MKEKIGKILKNENIYEIMRKDIDQRDKIIKKIMSIDGASALQVSRITGVAYHFIRHLE